MISCSSLLLEDIFHHMRDFSYYILKKLNFQYIGSEGFLLRLVLDKLICEYLYTNQKQIKTLLMM